ncbi:sulfatase-like hydrolase/transferase [Rubritalea spongiae]|uniref:Sulfatase-like hydrolase/transferase n=1 Tax=Rubritalea spongiae TaxID=430797 RepID=A0ABW5E6N5_9BACT
MYRSKLFLCFFLIACGVNAAERLNVINIMVDDMGYSDLMCMGGEIETPHIDSLAKGGILFTNYRTYPKCFPTRDAIMTGMDSPPVRTVEDGITIGEALLPAGYNTYFVGKTHGAVMDNFSIVPKRGFERSFGNEDGGNYWDPTLKQTMLDGKPWQTDAPFYKTDVHTDFAIQFLKEHNTEKPFFMHLAYHAPHYPIQAKEEDIEKYVGKFMAGPAALRSVRFARMQELGLIDQGTELSPMLKGMDLEWEKLSEEKKVFYDRVMAGYCAMIDNVDQNIGRVLQQLDAMGVRENTVIFFSSDNGGCPEGGKGMWPGHKASRFGKKYDSKAPFGSKETHWQVGPAWTNYSNTPLRKWKNFCHEGGLSVPFIVNAPSLIKEGGKLSEEPIMVMDVLPTILDLTGVSYPEEFNGRKIKPMRGVSLVPIFEGESTDLSRPMHFFYRDTTAYIEYPWKIVSTNNKKFELYNLEDDRSELNDLATQQPERLDRLMQAMLEYRGMPLSGAEKKGKK